MPDQITKEALYILVRDYIQEQYPDYRQERILRALHDLFNA